MGGNVAIVIFHLSGVSCVGLLIAASLVPSETHCSFSPSKGCEQLLSIACSEHAILNAHVDLFAAKRQGFVEFLLASQGMWAGACLFAKVLS